MKSENESEFAMKKRKKTDEELEKKKKKKKAKLFYFFSLSFSPAAHARSNFRAMERPLDLPDLFSSSTAAASSCGGNSSDKRRLLPPRAGGAIAADADGRLYVVRADGGISCGDIRDELLLDGKVRESVLRVYGVGGDWKEREAEKRSE